MKRNYWNHSIFFHAVQFRCNNFLSHNSFASIRIPAFLSDQSYEMSMLVSDPNFLPLPYVSNKEIVVILIYYLYASRK
jgi:hypothetical protein